MFYTKHGGFDEDMDLRIKSSWINWKEASNILCNEEISIRLK